LNLLIKLFLKFILFPVFLHNLILARDVINISDLKWKKRTVIIVNDENFDFKRRLKKYQKEIEERDIVLVFYNKSVAYLDNRIISKKFSKSVANKIKKINSNHQLILLGKDGGVKKTYSFETKITEIFYDIDQMPTRISEMRKKLRKIFRSLNGFEWIARTVSLLAV